MLVGDVQDVLGVPRSDLAEGWLPLVHEEDAPALTQALNGLERGRSLSLDYRILDIQAGERWVRDSIRRVPSREGADQLLGVIRPVGVERGLRLQLSALEERLWST